MRVSGARINCDWGDIHLGIRPVGDDVNGWGFGSGNSTGIGRINRADICWSLFWWNGLEHLQGFAEPTFCEVALPGEIHDRLDLGVVKLEARRGDRSGQGPRVLVRLDPELLTQLSIDGVNRGRGRLRRDLWCGGRRGCRVGGGCVQQVHGLAFAQGFLLGLGFDLGVNELQLLAELLQHHVKLWVVGRATQHRLGPPSGLKTIRT